MILIDKDYLNKLAILSAKKGYPTQKWIQFCEYYLDKGFTVKLYAAKSTVSKYVYVIKDNKQFKVRFSNHKPSYHKELNKDCDFFVGINNQVISTTEQAIVATNKYFCIE